jgi:hypothetical protein
MLAAAMKSTQPTPSILTTVVHAISNGKAIDHHPAMRITLHNTKVGWVLVWTGFDGRTHARANEAHTHFINSAGFVVRARRPG